MVEEIDEPEIDEDQEEEVRENILNKPKEKKTSPFHGVTFDSQKNKWQGHIWFKAKRWKICHSDSQKNCATKLHKWVTRQITKFNKYKIPGYDPDKDEVDAVSVEMMDEAGFDPKHSHLAQRREARLEALKEAGIEEDEEETYDN